MPRQRGLTRRLARFGAWGTTLLACWMLALLLLQVLFGRQLERIQTLQLGRDLALNIRLSELTLERYPPSLISELTGLELQVSSQPAAPNRETQASVQRRQELRHAMPRERLPLELDRVRRQRERLERREVLARAHVRPRSERVRA